MLSKTKVVKRAKKAFVSLYDGICTVTERQKIKKDNGSTRFEEVIVLENIPCRLSFKTVDNTAQTENGAAMTIQTTTLFLDPDIKIKSGSKITVTQNGVTTEYQQSGKAALYDTHQEIALDFFREWS